MNFTNSSDLEYLKNNGKVIFHISTPIKEHSICQFTIEIKTPLDPIGRCAIRMDMDFVNHYKVGDFNDPQELECDFGIRELKALSAFPNLLKILTNTEDASLKISTVLFELEQCGFTKGSNVDNTYNVLEELFNSISSMSFEQEINKIGM